MSLSPINTKWGISCNFLEYEQLRFKFQNFMRNHIDGTSSYLSLKGCAHFYKSIKDNRSILFQIKAKWEENLNDTINFDQIKTCFRLWNKTTEYTCLRYIQFKIIHSRLLTLIDSYWPYYWQWGNQNLSPAYTVKKIHKYMHCFIVLQPFNSQ